LLARPNFEEICGGREQNLGGQANSNDQNSKFKPPPSGRGRCRWGRGIPFEFQTFEF